MLLGSIFFSSQDLTSSQLGIGHHWSDLVTNSTWLSWKHQVSACVRGHFRCIKRKQMLRVCANDKSSSESGDLAAWNYNNRIAFSHWMEIFIWFSSCFRYDFSKPPNSKTERRKDFFIELSPIEKRSKFFFVIERRKTPDNWSFWAG